MKMNAKELRTLPEEDTLEKMRHIKRRPVFLLLENIYDTYNIGGLFRLADALAIEKLYLCGETEVPPNSKIKKASIGTYKVVPWEYRKTAGEVIGELRERFNNRQTLSVIAIEQDVRAVPYTQLEYKQPLALIVGNETYGVLPETLKLCDHIVEIPMWGINKSLNVIVSAAIVGYHSIGAIYSPSEVEGL